MTLGLYRDHHVPAAITGGLRRLGVDVLTAWEDTADRLPDDLFSRGPRTSGDRW